MIDQRKLHIKKLLEEGKTKDEIQQELVAKGVELEGFEHDFIALQREISPTPISSEPLQEKLPSIRSLIAHGLQTVRGKLKEIGIVCAIVGALTVVSAFGVYPPLMGIVITFALLLVSFLAAYALSYVVVASANGATLQDGLSWTVHRFFSIAWLALLTSLISLAGFLFLIIPALIFSVFALFSLIVLIREDKRGVYALLRSTDLVRGAFWGVAFKNFVPLCIIAFALLLVLLPFGILLSVQHQASFMVEVSISLLALFVQMTFLVFGLAVATVLYEKRLASKPLFEQKSYTGLKWFYRLAASVGIFVPFMFFTIASILIFGDSFQGFSPQMQLNFNNPSLYENTEGGLTFNDFLLQSNVKGTEASARIWGSTMGSYDGVCSDIAVVDPVVCQESGTSYVIYAPLSNGTYYCLDSSGFNGVIESTSGVQESCQ